MDSNEPFSRANPGFAVGQESVDEDWPLPPEPVFEFMERWGADPDTVQFLAAAKNAIFQCVVDGQDSVLRIHHTGERTESAILAELHWVRFLAQRDVAVARPVQSSAKRWVETIESDGGVPLRASALEFVPGGHPQFINGGVLQLDLIRQAGAILGRMHRLSDRYRPPREGQRSHWVQLNLPRVADLMAPDAGPEFKHLLAEHWDWMRSLSTNEGYGLVHGDFHEANILEDEGELTVLDFDNCYYSWHVSDIAHFLSMGTIALRASNSEERNKVGRAMFVEFMTGYLTQNRLRSHWFGHLPRFLRGFDLLFYFNLLCAFGGDDDRLSVAPYFSEMESSVLGDRPGLELDFVDLYRSIQVPKLIQRVVGWVARRWRSPA